MRLQGKITLWRDAEGFGFITPQSGGQRVFAHIRSFTDQRRRPVGNELVTYKLDRDAQGRTFAGKVALVGERRLKVAPSKLDIAPMGVAIFLAAMAIAISRDMLPPAIMALYLGASLTAFLLYAWDKSAAINGRWRTQESTLHIFALIGGWPGALLAQRLIRHKSKKRRFLGIFWATVIINCVMLAWTFTSSGTATLQAVLNTEPIRQVTTYPQQLLERTVRP